MLTTTPHAQRITRINRAEKYHAGPIPGNCKSPAILFCLVGIPQYADERPRHSLSWRQIRERDEERERQRMRRGLLVGVLLALPLWAAVILTAVAP